MRLDLLGAASLFLLTTAGCASGGGDDGGGGDDAGDSGDNGGDDDGGCLCDFEPGSGSCTFNCDCDPDCVGCVGTPDCAGATGDVDCGMTVGCSWEITGCGGSATSCINYPNNEPDCVFHGCSYNDQSLACTGTPTSCSSHTVGACTDYDGCDIQYGCEGAPAGVTCEQFLTMQDCFDQSGCMWGDL